MRADADFMVYVGARWPSLLREAVLRGCPPAQAGGAVTEALARCRRDWARAQREEGVDHLVRGELVRACARRPREATTEEKRREEAERLAVLAAPTLDELRDVQRAGQVRTARRALLVVVPLLLVAAGLTWWTTRGDHDPPTDADLGPAALTREENPAGTVTWWARGELHLDHVVLAVEGVRDMTRLGNGAVYGDDEGRVVYVADDGSRSMLGHKDPDVPVAATDETGLAAWFDPEAEEVVAVRASSGHVVLRTGVGDAPRVVAVDGDVVYLVGADGSRALLPTGPASQVPVSPGDLLDVRSRVRAFQLDESTIQVVQSYFDVSYRLPGTGASLSPDGLFVVTRTGTGDDDAEVVVYDARSGKEAPTGLATTDVVLAAAPQDRGTVAFIVAQGGLESGRDLQLRVCDLRVSLCRILERIPDDDSTPVLAR
jgi:hypothetical protein